MISGLEQRAYPSDAYEVIVVSDGSTHGTDANLETLNSTMRLHWLTQANRGPAAARNAGVQKATGEFVVFIDDDLVPEPQLLEEHARSHQEAGRDVVVLGALFTPEGLRWLPGFVGSKRDADEAVQGPAEKRLAGECAAILHR